MLKKLCVIFSLLIIFCGIAFINAQPVFKDYADSYEVYLQSPSSLAQIKRVDKIEYMLLSDIKGESVQVSKEGFDLEKLLSNFDAEIKFSEHSSDSQIFYAYSPKIKKRQRVKGQTINLHIVVSREKVVLGSPLIFGSF